MRTIMMVLMAGTVISASAMAGVSAVDNEKKIANGVEEAKAEIIELAKTDAASTEVVLANDVDQDGASANSKIADMFVVADLDADGFLTEKEYIDYQLAKARTQFSSMAGDDNVASVDEVKEWHLAQRTEKALVPLSDGASE